MDSYGFGGLLGLLILVLDIWAIIRILGSVASASEKLLWVVVIVLLPLIGLIIWWFVGPRGSTQAP